MRDFAANLLGAGAAMLAVTFLPGRRAAMIPVMVCPVLIPALVRSGFIAQGTIFEFAAYFVCFAAVTLAWVWVWVWASTLKTKFIALLSATANIILLKFYAVLTNKPMGKMTLLISFTAVILTVSVLFYIERVKRVANKNHLP